MTAIAVIFIRVNLWMSGKAKAKLNLNFRDSYFIFFTFTINN